MDVSAWEEPDPAAILTLQGEADWAALRRRYAGLKNRPLDRILEVARASGANTVVIETRYLDLDYRSEYSAFYSRTFEAVPDSAHRLHFFSAVLSAPQLTDLPVDHGYIGYTVIRPSELGQIGRTMLRPPIGVAESIRTCVKETVNFFGADLEVEAVPFMQQDTQLGRCAHAAAWMCHYAAHRRGEVGRQPMAEFSLSADSSLGWGRPLPSEGLTDQQMLDLFTVMGLPPAHYSITELPESPKDPWVPPDAHPPEDQQDAHPGVWDTRFIRIICRYLNSGLPVLVATYDHTFVLCGYARTPREGALDWISFFRNDDQAGPYLRVDDVLNDVDPATGFVYSPWEALMVPLPEKLWLAPEPAERTGSRLLVRYAERAVMQGVLDAQALLDARDSGRLAFKTYTTLSNNFKSGLENRVDRTLERQYRLARMSRYIWVVEAIDRELRKLGDASVLGEAVIDATSSETQPDPLILHVPGVATIRQTGGGSRAPRCSPAPYRSGGIGPP